MLRESAAECERARELDPGVNSIALHSTPIFTWAAYDKFLQSLPKGRLALYPFLSRVWGVSSGNLQRAAKDFDRAYELRRTPQTMVGKALSAASSGIGVREVTLVPITDKGDEVGTPISFSVRSSQVGILIWAIMGVGMALLVVMIIRRWVRRGLSRRSTARDRTVIEP